jgi:hypothetical protein
MLETHQLDYPTSIQFLGRLRDCDLWDLELSMEKQQLLATDDAGGRAFTFRLPLVCPPIAERQYDSAESVLYPQLRAERLESYLPKLPPIPPPYLIVLIQAGHAALGYYERDQLLKHKVIRKYMVRKKQGKAQITYLQSKGKSRAGSRIRLANTVTFFNEINTHLGSWHHASAQRVLFSCSARLWGLLHRAKVPPPFAKNDPRLAKIPRSVRTPNFKELQAVNYFVRHGQLACADGTWPPADTRLGELIGPRV